MKKKSVSKFKLQRRLLTELPGLGKPGALERKPYPPGQHGARRIKYSEYRLQLEEKQKVRCHYGLREEQLIRFVKKSKASAKTRWTDKLVNLLERRLDNFVFRAGFARSIAAARQLVSHGKVRVNAKKVDIKSLILNVGDVVELKEDMLENQVYLFSKQSPRLPRPDWIERTDTAASAKAQLKDQPSFDSLPFFLDESLLTSYYSKV